MKIVTTRVATSEDTRQAEPYLERLASFYSTEKAPGEMLAMGA
jgi:hypothetical protein